MSEGGKMVCPDCGVEMNRHAVKVDYTAERAEADPPDPDFGGALEEFHACPECGHTRSRPAG